MCECCELSVPSGTSEHTRYVGGCRAMAILKRQYVPKKWRGGLGRWSALILRNVPRGTILGPDSVRQWVGPPSSLSPTNKYRRSDCGTGIGSRHCQPPILDTCSASWPPTQSTA